jgi:hypothetical protein
VTLEDAGIIGELIAAVATVATLAYLAIQIRAAAAAMKADSRRNEQTEPYITSIVENADVAGVFLAGLADDPKLSPQDATRFAFLMGQYVGSEAAYFDEVKFGVGSPKRLKERQTQLMRFMSAPGGKVWWSRYGHALPEEFRVYVQNIIAAEDVT